MDPSIIAKILPEIFLVPETAVQLAALARITTLSSITLRPGELFAILECVGFPTFCTKPHYLRV